MNVQKLETELRNHASPEKAAFLPYFFKTGPGEYGEGDRFLGVAVPSIRRVAKAFQGIALAEVEQLLHSEWHEERMCALLVLITKFKEQPELRNEVYEFYLANTQFINNWDLVDLSAPDIVGCHVYDSPAELPIFDKLASSKLLWDRRIAMVGSYHFIKRGEPGLTLALAKKLLSDREDLMHKATGWMLREVYKRIDETLVEQFLQENYAATPRTTLRYAIERMPEAKRQAYLRGTF